MVLEVHGGPWGAATVVKLAFDVLHSATAGSSGSGGDGWTLESLRHCVETSDLSLQVERDRLHAGERAMESFPAVSVNRERVPDTLESLRRAIRAALQEGSI